MPRELFADPLAESGGSPWLAVAESFGATLRQGIQDLEAAGDARAVVDSLRGTGLLALTVPASLGGTGASWSTAAEVTRIIARTDAGIAHAIGYHYTWVWFVARYDTEAGNEILRRTAREQLFWASIGSAFGGSGSIEADADGFVIEAERGFATGAPLADLLFTQTVSRDDGRLYLTAVDTTSPGITVADDWDAVGQRLSASTSITLRAVRVARASVVTILPPPGDRPAPLQSLMIPAFQLLFGFLNLGIAEGALFEAGEYVAEHARPWIHSDAARSSEDPYILALVGEHAARVSGVTAQVRAAARVLTALFDGTLPITPESRGHTAELVAAAKVVSQRVGLDAASAVFEATGARSAARRFALDRFWRNIRTLSLHDPIAYKHAELGDYVLNGSLPEPSVYR